MTLRTWVNELLDSQHTHYYAVGHGIKFLVEGTLAVAFAIPLLILIYVLTWVTGVTIPFARLAPGVGLFGIGGLIYRFTTQCTYTDL